MLNVQREGQQLHFDDEKELLVFIAEKMAFKEDVDNLEKRVTVIENTMATKDDLRGMATKEDLNGMATKEDLKKMEASLKDYTDKKVEEVKHHTSVLLKNKEVINKDEALQYMRASR
ncbi:MAG: hypothetical protein Q8P11_03980 [bacterium]|nr:hypothetical protein [bacterium]